jgi:hypothetical protein
MSVVRLIVQHHLALVHDTNHFHNSAASDRATAGWISGLHDSFAARKDAVSHFVKQHQPGPAGGTKQHYHHIHMFRAALTAFNLCGTDTTHSNNAAWHSTRVCTAKFSWLLAPRS